MFTKEKTNICKGVGILLLLFHHMFRLQSYLTDYNVKFYLLPEQQVPKIAVSARVCVWIFVFLSAYGLMYKFIHLPDEKKKVFIARQWFSLMKPFWLVFLIFSMIYCLIGNSLVDLYQGNILMFVLDGLGWADFFHTPLLAGVFWYMCLAQIIILLIPVTHTALNSLSNYGLFSMSFIVIILLQLFPNSISSIYGGDYLNYLLVFLLGCLFACHDTMNKLSSIKMSGFQRSIVCIALLLTTLLLRFFRFKLIGVDQWRICGAVDSLSAVAICLLFGVFLSVPYLSKGLAFLGSYSGIMFLIHSMIGHWFPEIVYISRIGMVNYFAWIVVSLTLSVLIVFLKKWIRYDWLLDRLYNRISKTTGEFTKKVNEALGSQS